MDNQIARELGPSFFMRKFSHERSLHPLVLQEQESGFLLMASGHSQGLLISLQCPCQALAVVSSAGFLFTFAQHTKSIPAPNVMADWVNKTFCLWDRYIKGVSFEEWNIFGSWFQNAQPSVSRINSAQLAARGRGQGRLSCVGGLQERLLFTLARKQLESRNDLGKTGCFLPGPSSRYLLK